MNFPLASSSGQAALEAARQKRPQGLLGEPRAAHIEGRGHGLPDVAEAPAVQVTIEALLAGA